jgi:hypothetical protein
LTGPIPGALGGYQAVTATTCTGFYILSTRLTAIAGSAVLLIAYHLASSRTGHRTAHR